MTTVRVDATGPLWSGQFCLHDGASWTPKEVCSSCTILLLHRMVAFLKRLKCGVVAPKILALRVTLLSCTCLRRRVLCTLGAVICLSAAVFQPLQRISHLDFQRTPSGLTFSSFAAGDEKSITLPQHVTNANACTRVEATS